MRFENKVVIITGGSRGIGYATAEKFLSEGAAVVITASSPENVFAYFGIIFLQINQRNRVGLFPPYKTALLSNELLHIGPGLFV